MPWGWGRGWGWRWCYWATGLPGWMRWWYFAPPYPSREEEIEYLEAMKEELERELEEIKRRIEELKGKK